MPPCLLGWWTPPRPAPHLRMLLCAWSASFKRSTAAACGPSPCPPRSCRARDMGSRAMSDSQDTRSRRSSCAEGVGGGVGRWSGAVVMGATVDGCTPARCWCQLGIMLVRAGGDVLAPLAHAKEGRHAHQCLAPPSRLAHISAAAHLRAEGPPKLQLVVVAVVHGHGHRPACMGLGLGLLRGREGRGARREVRQLGASLLLVEAQAGV